MKCDELEDEYLWTNNVKTPSTIMVRAYNADDVDEAIAELKARIQLDDDEMAGFLQLEEECGGGDLRNYIAELKAELAEKDKDIAYWREEYDKETKLTDALKAEIESLKASHYTESVDAGMRERRLRRALWLLKARYFWVLMVYASDLAKVANPSFIHKSNFIQNPTPRCMEEYQHEAELYDNARIKSLNKAEEY